MSKKGLMTELRDVQMSRLDEQLEMTKKQLVAVCYALISKGLLTQEDLAKAFNNIEPVDSSLGGTK